jgi:hypothetical protein
MSSRVEKRCAVCGALYWKYRSENKKTCGKAECIAEMKHRHRLPQTGVCLTCGQRKKLLRKGRFADKKAQCKSCWNREHRFKECKNCGHVRRIHSHGMCLNCYFRLGLSKNIRRCAKCGKDRPHYAKGLCPSCYAGLMAKDWMSRHPEKRKEYYDRWMKDYLLKYRKEHPDKVRAWERKYREQFRKLTPERMARLKEGTSFVSTDNIGIAEGKVHARCVGKFFVGRWGRIIVYEMPRALRQTQLYQLQMIDIQAGVQSFITFPRDETIDFLEGFGIVFRPEQRHDG